MSILVIEEPVTCQTCNHEMTLLSIIMNGKAYGDIISPACECVENLILQDVK